MGDTFFENLFYKQEKQFEKINDLSENEIDALSKIIDVLKNM